MFRHFHFHFRFDNRNNGTNEKGENENKKKKFAATKFVVRKMVFVRRSHFNLTERISKGIKITVKLH